MTPDVREEFIRLLSLGQSPQLICHSLSVASADFFATARDDGAFAQAMEQAQNLKSRNVESVLYRKALEGHVPAMTQYLKVAPPPEWDPSEGAAETEDLSRLSLAELRDVAESMRDVVGRIADRDQTSSSVSEAGASHKSSVVSQPDSSA